MTEPTKACLRCYGHAINIHEATAETHVIATTGVVHKRSDEYVAKTECGQVIRDDWDTVDTVTATSVPATERPTLPRRRRNRHRPPSGRL